MAMPAPANRSGRRLIGLAIVATLLALVVLPGYLLIPPSWRSAVVRLAGAVVVAVGCVYVRRWARDALAAHAISPFDAPPAPPPAAQLDASFRKLHDDLIASTRSRRYFDVILWPRLSALTGAELPRPAERRVASRPGPSLHAIERIIAEIERRP
jgi:hypothetical protein